jgi:hypothetical protein
LPIVPLVSRKQHNFGRGKGQCLHHVSKEGKEEEIAAMLKNSGANPGTSEETIPEGQAGL